MRTRPVGVTIIAILAILGGLVQLISGLAFLGITALAVPGMEAGAFAEGVGIAAGVVMFIMAVLSVVFGVGALMLKPWAWMLGIVLFGISLVANLVLMFTSAVSTSAVISALIAAIVLAYLYTARVREAFGHGYEASARHHGGPVVHA